ncbi:hypothetical protein QL285_056622 [Trifolium repens]|nr:hypothetical protein QL285_056622 [Trifolium repens]
MSQILLFSLSMISSITPVVKSKQHSLSSLVLKNILPFFPAAKRLSILVNGPTSKTLIHDSLTPISPKIDMLKDACAVHVLFEIIATDPFNTTNS